MPTECQRKPYLLESRRVRKSPFRITLKAKRALSNSKRGNPIGFTARSSLKSMGLIKRSNGCYKLGSKYKY